MVRMRLALVASIALGVSLSAQGTFTPARFLVGTIPPFPDLPVGGGHVFVELSVAADGRVTDVTVLRTMPPFTDLVVSAVRGWQLVPAEETLAAERGGPPPRPQRVASKVLVAGLFGPTLGQSSKDVAQESDQTPFPLTTTIPQFPQQAHVAGVVLLEARVDAGGRVADLTTIRSASPYDDVARAAARQWTFRPARVRGRSVATRAYLLFGFSPAMFNNSPSSTIVAPIPPPTRPGVPLPPQR